MQVRWLGWAGVEIEADGASVVVDPLEDVQAVFAQLGGDGAVPSVVAPAAAGHAVAGLVTHLHRDHADAGALASALAPGAPVLHPAAGAGGDLEELGLAAAEHELAQAGHERIAVAPWATHQAGRFSLTALPAADGLGDPQVAWLVEAGGRRVLHLGDTAFHGFWWRMALRHGPFDLVLVPINGAVVQFPHRRPASPYPAVLDPEQAAVAAELLGAAMAIPIHYDGYALEPYYVPAEGAAQRFLAAAAGRPYEARLLGVGEAVDLGVAATAAA